MSNTITTYSDSSACCPNCPQDLPKVFLNFSIGQMVQAAFVKTPGTVAFGYDNEHNYGAVFLSAGADGAKLVSSKILDLKVADDTVTYDYFDGVQVSQSSFKICSKEDAQKIAEAYKTDFKNGEFITVTPEQQISVEYNSLYEKIKGDIEKDKVNDNTSDIEALQANLNNYVSVSQYNTLSQLVSNLSSSVEGKQDAGNYVSYQTGSFADSATKTIVLDDATISAKSGSVSLLGLAEETVQVGSENAALNLRTKSGKVTINQNDNVATEAYVAEQLSSIEEVYAEQTYVDDLSTRMAQEVATLTGLVTGSEDALSDYILKADAMQAINEAVAELVGIPEDSSATEEDFDTLYELTQKVYALEENYSDATTSLADYLKKSDAELTYAKKSEYEAKISEIESKLNPLVSLSEDVNKLQGELKSLTSDVESKADQNSLSDLEKRFNELLEKVNNLTLGTIDFVKGVIIENLDEVEIEG